MDLKEKIKKVVCFLPLWRLDTRSDKCIKLIGPERSKITARKDGERVIFYACIPESKNRAFRSWSSFDQARKKDFKPMISCALCRNEQAIALDLERRLIKNYLRFYRISKQELEAHNKKVDELELVETLAARILKGSKSHQRGEGQRKIYFDSGNVMISTFEGGCMRFEVNLNEYDKGLKLAAYLKENALI